MRLLCKHLNETRDEILYRLPYVHGLMYLHDILVSSGVECRWADAEESFDTQFASLRQQWRANEILAPDHLR